MEQKSPGLLSGGSVLRHLLSWHWVSSALALCGMLFFSFSGITLNHAADIAAVPQITLIETQLPAGLVSDVQNSDRSEGLPLTLVGWLQQELGLSVQRAEVEWTDHELYLSMPRPGGDAWLSILLPTGELTWESTDRGWIAWLNDLHKGRHTGVVWSWFIDVFAVVSLVFCLSGLGILAVHARERRQIWPVAGLGVVVPLLLLLLFVH